jgi:hypothetical protein
MTMYKRIATHTKAHVRVRINSYMLSSYFTTVNDNQDLSDNAPGCQIVRNHGQRNMRVVGARSDNERTAVYCGSIHDRISVLSS